MNLRKKLLSIFFINFLLHLYLSAQIAFFSFENNSSYKGTWNLSYDIPDFIADYIREKYGVKVLSPILTKELLNQSTQENLFELLSSKNILYLVRGKINEFSINRLIAGEPKIAQYETYSNNIQIEFEITDIKSRKIIFSETIEQKSSLPGIEITIYGQETDIRKEFDLLDRIKFGSDKFLKTLIGKNLLKFCDQFTSKVEKILDLPSIQKLNIDQNENLNTNLKREVLRGEILFIDENTKEVFINLGRRENILPGTILPVYAEGDTIYDPTTGEFLGITDKLIGEIEIIEVRGDRFSLGIIKSEKEKILKGNKIRKIVISPE